MMTKRNLFKYFAWLLGVACFACAGNPATSPAPLAEIPAELKIPQSVAINVDEIRSASGAGSTIKALVGSGGTFSDQIAFGADEVTGINQFVDGILGPLSTFTIPASPNTTTFETTVEDGGATLALKLDFSNFDFDGDGKDEGCSGHTAALPICMRLWVSTPSIAGGAYQRRLEGVFTAFPTPQDPGAGRLRGTNLFATNDQGGDKDPLFQVIYDRTDPLSLAAELFFGSGRSSLSPPDFDIKAHALTTQVGPVDHAIKTLFLSGTTDLGGGTSVGQYLGKFRVDADFWGGSVDLQNPSSHTAFQDKCAQISSGNEVPIGDCQNLNIDVGATGFLDFLNPNDILLPDDFPNAPTF